MKNYRWLFSLSALLIIAQACSAAGSGYDTKFPLPDNVSDFTAAGENSINFQTTLSLEESIAFYRDAFAQQGLTERTVNTAFTHTTFSLVFDGDPSGQAIVVQGVDLHNGKTSVNIRYENV